MGAAWRTDDDISACDEEVMFATRGQRNAIGGPRPRSRHLAAWLSIAVVVLLGTKPVSAHPPQPIPILPVNPYYRPPSADLQAIFEEDPTFGIIVLDTKYSSKQSQLYRRQVEDEEDAPPSTTTSKPGSASTTSTSISASTSSIDNSTIVIDVSANYTTPQPFDSNMGANFTSPSCPSFLKQLLNDTHFNNCSAMSTLIGTSTSFFQLLKKGPSYIVPLLNQSCNVPVELKCEEYFTNLGTIITEDVNCGEDFEIGNPVVVLARNALLSYKVMQTATCLANERTGNYCYVEMAANDTAWADIGVFHLANGEPMTPDEDTKKKPQPTELRELRRLAGLGKNAEMAFSCTDCLNKVMGILGTTAALDDDQPIHKTFKGGAEEVNKVCGADWVDTAAIDLAVARESGGKRVRVGESLGGLVVAVMVGVWLL